MRLGAMRGAAAVFLGGAFVSLAWAGAPAATEPSRLLACDAQVRAAPRTFAPYLCYYLLAFDPALRERAHARLAAFAPQNDDARLLVGLLDAFAAVARADYAAAERILTGLEPAARATPNGQVRAQWHALHGQALWGLSRPTEALVTFRAQADILHALGDAFTEATARSNIALAYASTIRMRDYTPAEKQDQLRLIRDALDTARRGGNRTIEAKCHLYLAQQTRDVRVARDELQCALDTPPEALALADRMLALRLLGESLDRGEPRDPDRAWLLFDEALALATRSNDLQAIARARLVRANAPIVRARDAGWTAALRRRFLDEYPAALDAIEAIRDRQSDETARARAFAQWALMYRRFAGALLRLPRDPPADDLAGAFAVADRMRARTLLDELDAAHATAASRERLRAEAHAAKASQDILVAQVRRALRPDEAFLMYQVSDTGGAHAQFYGGSFVIAVARDATVVRELPDESVLEPRIKLFVGLVPEREGGEQAGAESLHRDVLGPVLDALPRTVRRLVIAPDGILHALPFERLQRDAAAEPAGAVYAVSIVPSASAWLHARAAAAPHASTVLVLADPEPRGAVVLEPLPGARAEGRAIRRAYGANARVFEGAAATEFLVKHEVLGGYAIVHFAAHATADLAQPDRSAVVLAPGAAGEDGRLTPPEITALDFGGAVVILSGCHAAGGIELEGEGVLSLARAFFAAGARAVIGSRWRLRDDDAARFFARLYEHLAAGSDVAEALRLTRQQLRAEGAPTEAWAGPIVYGDGGDVPCAAKPRARLYAPRAAASSTAGHGPAGTRPD